MDDRTKIIETERPLFRFFGPDVTGADEARLTGQLAKVKALMSDRNWRTLAVISAITGASEASASARLRQLRSQGYQVDRRRVRGGLFEYRVTGQKS